jgi:hypothetical protein
MKHATLIFLSLFFSFLLPAQQAEEPNPMLVGMMKKQLKDWKENPPQTVPDELMKGEAFIPVNGKYDGEGLVNRYLDTVMARVKTGTGGASLYETENGELKLDYISLDYKWTSMPGWNDISIQPVITSVKDVKGKEMIMDSETYEGYLGQGYFDQDNYRGSPGGQGEMKVYLNRNVTFDDYPAVMTGEMQVIFPVEYEAYTFTAADTGKTKTVGAYNFTLLGMDKNTVMFRVQGKRGFNDAYEALYTNSKGRAFNGRRGNSCPYAFYMKAAKNKFEMSDAEINAFALESMKNFSSDNADDVHIVKVDGTVAAVTFYSIKATGQKNFPLKLTAR